MKNTLVKQYEYDERSAVSLENLSLCISDPLGGIQKLSTLLWLDLDWTGLSDDFIKVKNNTALNIIRVLLITTGIQKIEQDVNDIRITAAYSKPIQHRSDILKKYGYDRVKWPTSKYTKLLRKVGLKGEFKKDWKKLKEIFAIYFKAKMTDQVSRVINDKDEKALKESGEIFLTTPFEIDFRYVWFDLYYRQENKSVQYIVDTPGEGLSYEDIRYYDTIIEKNNTK